MLKSHFRRMTRNLWGDRLELSWQIKTRSTKRETTSIIIIKIFILKVITIREIMIGEIEEAAGIFLYF
jgi:hypothetical protein